LDDSFDLQRFVAAQDRVIDAVMAELRAGRKRSHWMWFVFPQLRGLGASPMAVRFSIGSLPEAAAYAAHPLLGPRLRDCTRLVLAAPHAAIAEIFAAPDDLKFHSSMTLFARAAADEPLFPKALARFFGGVPDARTEALLQQQ